MGLPTFAICCSACIAVCSFRRLCYPISHHRFSADLQPYFRPILINLLTRMQTSKTDKYVYLFTYFLLFTMAIQVDGLAPDYLIGTVEQIQTQ